MEKALTPERMMAVLQERVKLAGGAYAFARANGVDLGYLSRVMRGLHPIGGKVMDALGYRKIIRVEYEEITK